MNQKIKLNKQLLFFKNILKMIFIWKALPLSERNLDKQMK